MSKNLISYASYFISYILDNVEDINNFNKIILFGSVSREEATKESDIDIFIVVNKLTKVFEKKLNKLTEEFYKSRNALVFKNKGIDNKINLIIGKLEKWKELKKSIDSTGIVLYGGYIPSGVEGKKYALFYWNKIEKNRGAFLNKIYGFKVGKKEYKGLIEILEGKKIGKSSIMVPIEYKREIFKLIKKYKVNSRIIEVYY
jgi:predicted nucleotidyltransferase